MSLESNKKDFERALAEMVETIELLKHCVDEDLVNTLECVVTEYEGHYVSDIEEMLGEIQELTDEIQTLRDSANGG